MAGSINGRILRVDLTEGRIWTEEPGDAFYRKYPGGRAIIAHYLLTEVPPETDALGPDNRLIFAMGPITGVQLPGNARHSVGAKSPLTGFYGEGEAGGFWNAELKDAGWDAIVVQGAAIKPVYLWIDDLNVEIRDAGHLWGKITGDVEEAIQLELGVNVRVAQTGIAGENLVKIASVCNDLNEFAGRCGMGAVMGSKKLKAIAVRGSNRTTPVDIGPIRETTRWVPTTFGEGQEHFIMHEWGTGARVRSKQIEGHVISHNFRDGMLEGAENVDAQAMKATVVNRMDGCFVCSVRCKKRVKFASWSATSRCKISSPLRRTDSSEQIAAIFGSASMDTDSAAAAVSKKLSVTAPPTLSMNFSHCCRATGCERIFRTPSRRAPGSPASRCSTGHTSSPTTVIGRSSRSW